MNHWLWFLVGWHIAGLLVAIHLIGKPRRALTPGDVIITAIITVGIACVTLKGAGVW